MSDNTGRENQGGETAVRGKVFADRYEVIEPIARGGMAEVFKARDRLLNRKVALKVLHRELSADPAFVERFKLEAQAAASLSHPNIVSVFDWGTENGDYFMVMEYVDGRTLREVLLQDGRLMPRRAIEIACAAAAALNFAHRHGVVHRDVKPGNILITSTGDVKVADFGIARAIGASENLTQTGAVIGTAAYFSPEQAQGKQVDARTDVYALGVVLYEMLTGRIPFAGDTPFSIAYKHVREAPVPPGRVEPDIPSALDAVVLKALAKSPANRYATAEDFRQDLLRIERGEKVVAAPIAAPAPPPAAEERMPESRAPEQKPRRWPYVFVLLALMILLGIGLYLLGKTLGIFGGPGPTAVPGVVGQTYDPGAKQAVEQLGLTPVPSYKESSVAEMGKVLSQDPPAGTALAKGGEVRLLIGKGPGTGKVPKVTELDRAAAEKAITDAGFTVGSVTEENSDSVPAGSVIAQDPAADRDVQKGTPVSLVISKGKEKVTVPAVIGKDQNEAIRSIQDAGLQVGQITQQASDAPANSVTAQSPKGGSEADKGSTVALTISSGPNEVTVPYLILQSKSAASATLATLGLKVSSSSCTPVDPSTNGKVVAQSPAPDTAVEKASTVKITVAESGSGGAPCPPLP